MFCDFLCRKRLRLFPRELYLFCQALQSGTKTVHEPRDLEAALPTMSATAMTHSHASDHAQEWAARWAEEAEATTQQGSAPGEWSEEEEDCDSSLPGFDNHDGDGYDDCYDHWEACVGGPSARSGGGGRGGGRSVYSARHVRLIAARR